MTAEQDFLAVADALNIDAAHWSENSIQRRFIMEKVVRKVVFDPGLFPIIAPALEALGPEFHTYRDRAKESWEMDEKWK